MFEDDNMLTTVDNPFDPRTNYQQWWLWDKENYYNTPEYIARVAQVSVEDDETIVTAKIKIAINEILENDVLGIYKIA